MRHNVYAVCSVIKAQYEFRGFISYVAKSGN